MKTTPENKPIEFDDGVHPTMETKVTYGWIRTDADKAIVTIASITRLNLIGFLGIIYHGRRHNGIY